ncbi:hypothetical protein PFLUV_G00168470 [Perca fluviatilis]|uniref:C-type lectin domain-containing protein n=1 Tax=Perca fluviatilis TaxID=8168 RepID=A0A6A5EEK8_PERFL|nr:hypothetical protein PFLUV_G00168470 [Perca fluviatilis]
MPKRNTEADTEKKEDNPHLNHEGADCVSTGLCPDGSDHSCCCSRSRAGSEDRATRSGREKSHRQEVFILSQRLDSLQRSLCRHTHRWLKLREPVGLGAFHHFFADGKCWDDAECSVLHPFVCSKTIR